MFIARKSPAAWVADRALEMFVLGGLNIPEIPHSAPKIQKIRSAWLARLGAFAGLDPAAMASIAGLAFREVAR